MPIPVANIAAAKAARFGAHMQIASAAQVRRPADHHRPPVADPGSQRPGRDVGDELPDPGDRHHQRGLRRARTSRVALMTTTGAIAP